MVDTFFYTYLGPVTSIALVSFIIIVAWAVIITKLMD